MHVRFTVLLFAALTTALFVASDASAQFGGMGAGGFGATRGARPARGMDGLSGARDMRNDRPEAIREPGYYETVQYRLALLHENLKVTTEQEPAWLAFARSVREYATDVVRENTRGNGPNADGSPEVVGLRHIEQTLADARTRLAALEQVDSSGKAFYQALTPQQKALADTRIPAIVGPQPAVRPAGKNSDNLPDIGGPVLRISR